VTHTSSTTVSYPAGYAQADFTGGNASATAVVVINGNDVYEEADSKVALTYNAASVSVQNLSDVTWPTGAEVLAELAFQSLSDDDDEDLSLVDSAIRDSEELQALADEGGADYATYGARLGTASSAGGAVGTVATAGEIRGFEAGFKIMTPGPFGDALEPQAIAIVSSAVDLDGTAFMNGVVTAQEATVDIASATNLNGWPRTVELFADGQETTFTSTAVFTDPIGFTFPLVIPNGESRLLLVWDDGTNERAAIVGSATTGLSGTGSEDPEFASVELGHATDTTLSRSAAGVMAVEGVPLFSNIPQNSQSAAYGLVLSDAQKHIFHPSADTSARTWTIPANASVAYPIGTAITFINQNSAGAITIAITSDTMRLAGAGTTGSRTLAANGIATAVKVTATEWIISGTGLT
jgi:hypothetical protein